VFKPGQNGSAMELVQDIDACLELGQISQSDHDRWVATLTKAISSPDSRALRGYVSMVVHRELQSTLSHR
jgi:hypothetical protein